MFEPNARTRWLTLGVVALGVAVAFWAGVRRLRVETDITEVLPGKDPVVRSAKRILSNHPALDVVTIDLSTSAPTPDPDRLVAAAQIVERRLLHSGLFDRVGIEDAARAMPRLFALVVRHLPQLFDESQLRSQVARRLEPERVRAALEQNLAELVDLQGVGQSAAIAGDPLRLRELVLARLSALRSAAGARIYKNHILDAQGRHLLLLADPRGSGSDTAQARRLVALLDEVRSELGATLGAGPPVTLNAIGAFRSALDNETIARADTRRAVVWATVGVALLLLLCFSRPWLGLLALVPALAGAALAVFAYSLIESSISALALGFGGALIAIAVDHGIAYLQFLDRPEATSGKRAAREVWAVGLFATLTTVGAFLTLTVSGFDMLAQVGLFAALGIGFSFAFVHTVFPLVFPKLSGARRASWLPVMRWLTALTNRTGWLAAGLCVALAAALTLVGWPDFEVDLGAMNTVKPSTLRAERQVTAVWGDVFQRTYAMVEAESLEQLRRRLDRLEAFVHAERAAGVLAAAFTPAQVLPGRALARERLRAWRSFFSPERVAALRARLGGAGRDLGFAPDAFEPFFEQLERPVAEAPAVPPGLHELLGLSTTASGRWMWLGAVQPGPAYRADAFCPRATAAGVAVFDPALFTERLSRLLGDSFLRMLVLIGLAVVGLLLILFVDWLLVVVTCLPLIFALVCTLGSLELLGRPIDIPGLMLAIVVLGMGVDYALFFVRGQQRHFDPQSPLLGPTRTAVFLAASSTMVGLGTLAAADHAVARSAGLTTLLGIGFSLLGCFALLPPMLNRIFAQRPHPGDPVEPGSSAHRRRVRRRYRHLEPYPRLFARFKLRLDPMFLRLAELVGPAGSVLDVGCGYAVPAAWLLAARPTLRYRGIEPDPQRARVAARVVGDRGVVECAAAPDLGTSGEAVEAALLLDVIHHLSDEALATTLARLGDRLSPQGRLIVRADLPGSGRFAWERWLETVRLRLAGRRPRFRSLEQLERLVCRAGFRLERVEPSAPSREETWLVAVVGENR